MKKVALSLILLILLQNQCYADYLGDAVALVLNSSCRVSADTRRGSGMCISKDDKYHYIITNAHVVGTQRSVYVEFFKQGLKTYRLPGNAFKIWFQNGTDLDLAMIAVDNKFFKVHPPDIIPLAPDDNGVGENYFIVSAGCPLAGWLIAWQGKIEKVENTRLIFTPPPKSGQSGSGIVSFVKQSDGSYRAMVVGIVTWRISPGSVMLRNKTDANGFEFDKGGAIPVSTLNALLRKENHSPIAIPANYECIAETVAAKDPFCQKCDKTVMDHALGNDGEYYCVEYDGNFEPTCNTPKNVEILRFPHIFRRDRNPIYPDKRLLPPNAPDCCPPREDGILPLKPGGPFDRRPEQPPSDDPYGGGDMPTIPGLPDPNPIPVPDPDPVVPDPDPVIPDPDPDPVVPDPDPVVPDPEPPDDTPEIRKLREEVRILKSQIEQLETRIGSLNTANGELQGEKDRLLVSIQIKLEELEEKQKELDQLILQNNTLNLTIKERDNTIQEKDNKVTELEGREKLLVEKFGIIETEKEKIITERNELQVNLDTANGKVTESDNKLSSLLNQRNLLGTGFGATGAGLLSMLGYQFLNRRKKKNGNSVVNRPPPGPIQPPPVIQPVQPPVQPIIPPVPDPEPADPPKPENRDVNININQTQDEKGNTRPDDSILQSVRDMLGNLTDRLNSKIDNLNTNVNNKIDNLNGKVDDAVDKIKDPIPVVPPITPPVNDPKPDPKPDPPVGPNPPVVDSANHPINDYAYQFFKHKEQAGERTEDWALKAMLYKEAIEQLRLGKFYFQGDKRNPLQGQQKTAEAIDTWVTSQFVKSMTRETFNRHKLYHDAMIGFLYQDAVQKLREGYFSVLGHEETANAIDNWVNKEFLRRMGVN
jgi:hypothetical protein